MPAVWYPTNNNHGAVTIAENAIFYGHEVTPDAEPKISTTKYPLALLSHGYGGSWQNLSWLANELALKGYIVAAPNHPQEQQYLIVILNNHLNYGYVHKI